MYTEPLQSPYCLMQQYVQNPSLRTNPFTKTDSNQHKRKNIAGESLE